MDNKQPSPTRVFLRIFIGTTLLLILFSWLVGSVPIKGSEQPKDITVTELYKALDEGKVKSLVVNVEDSMATGEFTDGKKFRSTVFDANDLVEKAVKKGIPVTRQKTETSWFGWGLVLTFVIVFLPTLLLIGAIVWSVRRQTKMAGDLAQMKDQPDRPKTKYSDVAGCDEAIEEMKEVATFLGHPTYFTKMGATAPRGVLLIGPPGTGKTLLAKATAGESAAAFISTSGSDFVEIFVGMGARHVREIFAMARKNQPCIVFIDELDAVAARRTMQVTHEEYSQTLDALLSEMDGFGTTDQVMIIAATNRPEVLDPAILRPGRFDRKIVVPLPDVRGREAILKIHARGKQFDPDVDFSRIARGTSGLSGADLAAILNEAAILAIRGKKEVIDQSDLNEAIDKVIMGPARKQVTSEKEKAITAYHEGGHALVTTLLRNKGSHPVRKVTIVPRGPAGGVTWTMPDEDVHIKSKEMLMAELAVAMGGRAGEMYKFNAESSGASGDFRQASKIAREMVCEYGMSDLVGKEAFVQSATFLGMKSDSMNCSEATKQMIDAEVKRLLDESYDLACKLITDNQDKLELIAKALLEKETLDGREVEAMVDGP